MELFTFKILNMKTLIKKKETKETKETAKVAQCCAKTSKTVAGCHD